MRPSEPGRVGYVLKMYPRLAETFILNELLAHEDRGLQLEIFSLRSPVDSRFHEALGRVKAPVTYLRGPAVKAEEFWSTLRRTAETCKDLDLLELGRPEDAGDFYQAMLLADAVRARGITHLHAHFATLATTVARLASAMTGVPFSFTAHAKDIFHESVEESDMRRKLRNASSVVTVSDFNVDYLRSHYDDDASRVTRIYNGLDLSEFTYEPPENREPLVIGVGRLVDKKGFRDLIDACAVLVDRGRDFRCEIIGDGVLREQLAQRVETLGVGDRVTLVGSLPREKVKQRVRQAALMAAPCVVSDNGNRDGLPTVLLEAMALGTPCISTGVTGIPELVRDGETGLITAQHDPTALADAIERLLDDTSLGMRLAGHARSLIEAEFDIDRNTPRLREAFCTARPPPLVVEVG